LEQGFRPHVRRYGVENYNFNPGTQERSGGMGVFVGSGVEQIFVSAKDVGATKDTWNSFDWGPNGGSAGSTIPLEVNVSPGRCTTCSGIERRRHCCEYSPAR
jgi:hypothetical protein